jgi:hypothetical protein
MSLVVVKKGYDSEAIHVLARKGLKTSVQHHSSKIRIYSNIEKTWQVQETDEMWLSQTILQSM